MNEEENKPAALISPNLADFLVALDAVLASSDEKSKMRALLKAIKVGYGPDRKYLPAPREVEQISNWLKDKVDVLDLCLKQIATSARPGVLVQQLRQVLATQIRQLLEFPTAGENGNIGEVKAAIAKHLGSCRDQEQLSLAVKRCVVAVWLESKARTELLRYIVDKSLAHRNRKYDASASPKSADPYGAYFDAVLRSVCRPKVDFKAFEHAQALGGPLRIEADEFERIAGIAREEKFVAEEQLHAKAVELEVQLRRAKKLESDLRDALDQLADTRSELALEQRKSAEIRSTLTTRHGNELGGQVRRLEKLLALEIEEAIMCLDRDEPNVPMALNRIRDLDSSLKKFVESETK